MGEPMPLIKRWAFYPLLAVVCVVLGASVGGRHHEAGIGTLLGLAASLAFALVVDRRRQRRRSARLLF